MKVSVIGAGSMGKNHIRIWKEWGFLHSIVEPNKNEWSSLKLTYGVPIYETLDQLLEYQLIDAISIAVPTPLHVETTIKCLEAGVHVLVEKPMADTIENAKKMIEVSKRTNKILTVGYLERYNPAYQKLKELVTENYFGEITSVNVKRVGGLPRSAKNVITDLMTHDLDLVMNLFERKPDQIVTFARQAEIVNSAQTLMKFGNASAVCEANWVSPIKIREMHVTGTKGYVKIDLIKQELISYEGLNTQGTQRVLRIESFNKEPLKEELTRFMNKCNSSLYGENIVSSEEGLRALEITLQADESRLL